MQSNPQERRRTQKEKNTLTGMKEKTFLTLTGLLMEGLDPTPKFGEPAVH
jgi:hypothetical protein